RGCTWFSFGFQFCASWFSVRGAPEKVLALAGGYVVLPCSFNITASSYFPTVEWSKKDLRSNIIFLYRDGCETYEMKNPAYEFRTSLIAKDLKNGDVSLRISDVQLSDAGQYQCMRLWKNSHKDITVVELAVGTSSQVFVYTDVTGASHLISLLYFVFIPSCPTLLLFYFLHVFLLLIPFFSYWLYFHVFIFLYSIGRLCASLSSLHFFV
uniref:Ig-like domain-containing protein n=1 Tax=Monopterus albus TaxID=43700 RepID=A0A3Q3JIB4_MONAL